MNQGFAHQVKSRLLDTGGDFPDDAFEEVKAHRFFAANHLWAKTALKVADIADLDIYLIKTLCHGGNLSQFQGFYLNQNNLKKQVFLNTVTIQF